MIASLLTSIFDDKLSSAEALLLTAVLSSVVGLFGARAKKERENIQKSIGVVNGMGSLINIQTITLKRVEELSDRMTDLSMALASVSNHTQRVSDRVKSLESGE